MRMQVVLDSYQNYPNVAVRNQLRYVERGLHVKLTVNLLIC
jgi:hypothetical protein